MVMNLQFFGGRGSSSGISNSLRQVSVNMDGQTVTYRTEKGQTYRIATGNVTGDKIPRSLEQIVEAARKAGYDVKTYNNKEYLNYMKEYQNSRKQADKELNKAYVSDKNFVKGSRMLRDGNRATRKKK